MTLVRQYSTGQLCTDWKGNASDWEMQVNEKSGTAQSIVDHRLSLDSLYITPFSDI